MVVVDYELRKKVMDAHIEDTLKYCYQCARCTDVCPVSKVTNQRYNPRPVILNSFLESFYFIMISSDNKRNSIIFQQKYYAIFYIKSNFPENIP